MHLFSAKPGGYVDDEGIIDLEQTPADLVILSASDSTLAGLASSIDSLNDSLPSIRLANWLNLIKPAAYDFYEHKVLEKSQLVVLSLLGGESYWSYGVERLQAWVKAAAGRHLIVVPGDDQADQSLFDMSSIGSEQAVKVWRYLREGGYDNYVNLVYFLAGQYLDFQQSWREPMPLPRCSLYRVGGNDNTATYEEIKQRWQHREDLPIVILLFYRSHVQSANLALFNQLISTLESQQLNVLPLSIISLKDQESLEIVNHFIEQLPIQLIINTTSFSSNAQGNAHIASEPTRLASSFIKPLPVLQLLLGSSTQEDWESAPQGLRSRDVAMQVVLPEMDGRIITRAVGFKSEAWYSEKTQITLVRYGLYSQGADFVSQLAKRYIVLSHKDNSEKRIALILANYPTKDGRIGNGVGLDTPASVVNILQGMKAAAYTLDDLPENGNTLIEALLGAVTNNPETLQALPCCQSLGLDDYQHYFSQLPEQSQQAVIERWGSPESDIKCRNQRLMIAGIRLGQQFIGIQPARGFNVDLLANYHDPDLVPPHSYLAFYFWLRHIYQVDAVVHVGKHGNLEWLPGKGLALSDQCWPDIALGPIPHFYPFIVNDPGEGAQAKRRTQAVIIDHLMPPMARAEIYGDLAELEKLTDEYYQAMGMDGRREQWLREQIIELVQKSHLYEELFPNKTQQPEVDSNDLLNELDTYLCDIKESQIRHGLHVLGELPEPEKLSETLVALLRLPRGSDKKDQGILHALSEDLTLYHQGKRFDPLQSEVEPWGEAREGEGKEDEHKNGGRPEILQNLTQKQWRTTADTRERLELLAHRWVSDYLLGDATFDKNLRDQYPNTSALIEYAKAQLLNAIKQSADNEISALINGLSGGFVEPGPSGAPTRGRLDTLPTGRNFFSVDNRSIPSPAAWALGQKSAQQLIERHLQEQGDYPRELGLSVWGTSTMRTGGDDIAQAFALMGVKPIWAAGSQRVVDIEVIPSMLLQRPRVDVTLRVSGFFRDAFSNVMRLFDAAVLAIAELQEPGEDNTIAKHIQSRVAALLAEGMNESEAKRQASYRVFGSKPGAYGAGLQGLIDEHCWESAEDLAEAYRNWGGYAYGGQFEGVDSRSGVPAMAAFQHRLSRIDTVIQNQDNREHDLLDSDDYYQFQGGMANAVNVYRGQAPSIYHGDNANPAQPKIRTLKEELNKVIRSRVLNPKWINAMREHGYKGAFEMAASVDYLFAYDATTGLIDNYQYEQVSDALLFDKDNQEFLKNNNPAAMEEMAERLLEAIQRGLWGDAEDYEQKLQDLLLEIDAAQEGKTT